MLGAGLLHAGWNALLKTAPGGDPLLDTATVVAGSVGMGTRSSFRSSPLPDARGVEVRRGVVARSIWAIT